MALDMSKFLARFADEAREHVEKLSEGLIKLEKDPADSETINAIFRSAHTIKGSSRMMKLTDITEVAHKMEDALGALREKKIVHSKALADLLFRAIDVVSDMIEKVAAGQTITADNTVLCEDLIKAAGGDLQTSKAPEAPSAEQPVQPATTTVPVSQQPEQQIPAAAAPQPPKQPPAEEVKRKPKPADTVRINAEKLDDLIKLMGEIVSNQNRSKQRLLDVKEIERTSGRCMKILSGLEHGDITDHKAEIINTTRSLFMQIKQLVANVKDDNNIQELLTDELQGKALMMRMVPLSMVFDSLHRMVRDISGALGKEIDFIVEGGDIELDKKMIEKIGDPLVHMIRNSLDHGIENTADRISAGKPARGTIKLSASYDTGSVLIELSDDGDGVPVEKIKEKALRKRMFSEETLNAMSENELVDLIFNAGFSTSAIITDVSGRGVGMDVVKSNIVDDLHGSITVETKSGSGTVFYIRLPITLAVMRVLLISASDMVFAVSSNYAGEVLRVPESEFIDVVDKKAIRLRNEFIPVADLSALLRLPVKDRPFAGKIKEPLIMVVNAGSEKLGLVVDALLDEEDMVIKALPAHMKKIHLVSGLTISGRNEIINVLHIPAVIEAAREIKGERPSKKEDGKNKSTVNILVVDDSVSTREIEKSILEAYGYKVTVAEDGMEGLEMAREFKYNLVITDVEMPRLDGFSLTERLRSEDQYRDTPIIIVTSREKEEDKKRGIMVGADAYIVKGAFDQSSLLETVQNLVG